MKRLVLAVLLFLAPIMMDRLVLVVLLFLAHIMVWWCIIMFLLTPSKEVRALYLPYIQWVLLATLIFCGYPSWDLLRDEPLPHGFAILVALAKDTWIVLVTCSVVLALAWALDKAADKRFPAHLK